MPSKKCPLLYHESPEPGKIMIRPSKAIQSLDDLGLAYTPGVAQVCQAIADDPSVASQYTARNKTVAVISNGTAVLGLGNIGALASKPVMEGKAALFYRFGGIQSIDIEIQEKDPEKLIDIIASLEPSFGAINLEDIKAPDCFMVERALCEKMSIPIFHDDQHGTAVVVTAALLNALHLKNQSIESAKCVMMGAGSAAIACLKLLSSFGLKKENIFLCDSKGIVHTGRDGLSPEKAMYARPTHFRTLKEALCGADILIGLAKPGVIAPEDIQDMARQPIIFPLSNPHPEISPEDIRSIYPDALIGTGQSKRPNQINNLLCFPYIFRGCMDVDAKKISEGMKKACVQVLMSMARRGFSDSQDIYEKSNQDFGAEYLIPYAFDPMLRIEVSKAVAEQALQDCSSNQSSNQSFSLQSYHQKLAKESYHDRPILGALIGRLPYEKKRLWYVVDTDTVPNNILDSAQYMERYNLASVGLVTNNPDVQKSFKEKSLLANIPVLIQAPCETGSLCIRVGNKAPPSAELVGFYSGQDLILQSIVTPNQSIQKVLSYLGYDIEWEKSENNLILYGTSCLFMRTPPKSNGGKAIGPLRIADHLGLQWVNPKESTISAIEKSCFVILGNFLV